MDTSKQGAALLMQHFLNVFLAMFWAEDGECDKNPGAGVARVPRRARARACRRLPP